VSFYAGRFASLLSIVLLSSTEMDAQGTGVHRLVQMEGRAPDEFLEIAALRILPGGDLLVADSKEELLYHLRPTSGERRVIGGKGSGPSEYRAAGALLALRADSTVLPDMANGRWHLIVGERIAETWPGDHPIVSRLGGRLIGADDLGRIYALRRLPSTYPAGPFHAESSVVVRFDRQAMRQDTVTRLRGRPMQPPSGAGAALMNPLAAQAFGIPMLVAEQAMVFPDGWVAVARLDPYRVDWHTPNGHTIRGDAIAVSPLQVTAAEKSAYQDRAQRDLGRPVRVSSSQPWPGVAHPIEDDALAAGPDGTVWIRLRSPGRDSTVTYQIIGRNGRLLREIAISRDSRVLGLVPGRAFVRTIDPDGLHRLEWYRLP
jgi:hypothetical protein